MSDPDDLEAELLRRFQALKSPAVTSPSTRGVAKSYKEISEDQARKAKEEDDELERIADGRPPKASTPDVNGKDHEEMEFAKRMARLRGVELEQEEDEGDQEVDDFIASLSSQATSTPSLSTIKTEGRQHIGYNTKTLEQEARDTLKASSGLIKRPEDEDEEETKENDDFETEDEILLRALEEAELEAELRLGKGGKGPKEADDVAYENETEQDILARARAVSAEHADDAVPRLPTRQNDDESSFSFPSLPSHIPSDVEDPVDPEADAKMALLLGLSGPRSQPGPPRLPSPPKTVGGRQPGQGWNLPGYKDDRDEDPDSWCCICNKDADVICLGCDDDPYCEECWTEGHVGERHRTKRYARGGRRAVGA